MISVIEWVTYWTALPNQSRWYTTRRWRYRRFLFDGRGYHIKRWCSKQNRVIDFYAEDPDFPGFISIREPQSNPCVTYAMVGIDKVVVITNKGVFMATQNLELFYKPTFILPQGLCPSWSRTALSFYAWYRCEWRGSWAPREVGGKRRVPCLFKACNSPATSLTTSRVFMFLVQTMNDGSTAAACTIGALLLKVIVETPLADGFLAISLKTLCSNVWSRGILI